MFTRCFHLLALGLALLAAAAAPVDAAPANDLAAQAVSEAKSMPPGRFRDLVLRTVSRNLRHADRDHAIEAAAAMSDDTELRSFDPGPDRLIRQWRAHEHRRREEAAACARFIERLRPGSASAADERRLRDCFAMDQAVDIDAWPLPPFRLILAAAEALPPGSTKASLLYRASWDGVPERPPGGAREALRRMRALIPRLDPASRREAARWLDTAAVDLIEGEPDEAIARVRQALATPPSSSSATGPAEDGASQARGLIADFLTAGDVDRAIEVTALLSPSNDCSTVADGVISVMMWVLPQQESRTVATYMARLETSGLLTRLCPNGWGGESAVEIWIAAGDEAKALQAATASGSSLVIAGTRLALAERRLQSGDVAGARSILLAAAAGLPALDSAQPFDNGAARQRARLIHRLAEIGEVEEAERLASAYPGPGWRALAYSIIVATVKRESASPNWAGPFHDLQEVPADQ